jgi:hypothetical protein
VNNKKIDLFQCNKEGREPRHDPVKDRREDLKRRLRSTILACLAAEEALDHGEPWKELCRVGLDLTEANIVAEFTEYYFSRPRNDTTDLYGDEEPTLQGRRT